MFQPDFDKPLTKRSALIGQLSQQYDGISLVVLRFFLKMSSLLKTFLAVYVDIERDCATTWITEAIAVNRIVYVCFYLLFFYLRRQTPRMVNMR